MVSEMIGVFLFRVSLFWVPSAVSQNEEPQDKIEEE
jgi:hypothetical protein